jgi:hypothetical protein
MSQSHLRSSRQLARGPSSIIISLLECFEIDGRHCLHHLACFCPATMKPRGAQAPNLSAARALAFAASSSRFLGTAVVASERRRRVETPAISSTAARNEPSFDFDGLLNPLIFLTN